MRALKKRGVDIVARRYQQGVEDVVPNPDPVPPWLQAGYDPNAQGAGQWMSPSGMQKVATQKEASGLYAPPYPTLTGDNLRERDEAEQELIDEQRGDWKPDSYKTIGVNINGVETEIPQWGGQTPVEAEDMARMRLEWNLDPFASDDELEKVQNAAHQGPDDASAVKNAGSPNYELPPQRYQSGTEDVEATPTPTPVSNPSSYFNRQALDTARQRGYNDDQIYERLSKVDPRFATAKSNGFALDDIADHLTKASPTPQPTATPQAGEVAPPQISPSGIEASTAYGQTQGAPTLDEQRAMLEKVPEGVKAPLEAAAETVGSFVPHNLEQAAQLATSLTPIGPAVQSYRAARSIAEGRPLEALSGIPVAQRIPEIIASEGTAPFSKERYKAGFGTLADLLMVGGIGAMARGGAAPVPEVQPRTTAPTLTETLFGKQETPLVAETNQSLADLEARYGTQPEIPNAIQPSNAQVETGQTAQRVETGTEGAIPAASSSDNALREAQGAAEPGEIPARQGTEAGTQTPEAAVAPQAEVAAPQDLSGSGATPVTTAVVTGDVRSIPTTDAIRMATDLIGKDALSEKIKQQSDYYVKNDIPYPVDTPEGQAGLLEQAARDTLRQQTAPVPAAEAATTAAPEIPEGSKATIRVKDTEGNPVEIKDADAKEWESKFKNERDSYQKLIDCLNA